MIHASEFIIHQQLHFNHDRENHRAAFRLGKEELAEDFTNLIAHHIPVDGSLFRGSVFHDFFHLALGFVHEVKVLFDMDESTRRDLDGPNNFLGFAIDDDGDHRSGCGVCRRVVVRLADSKFSTRQYGFTADASGRSVYCADGRAV